MTDYTNTFSGAAKDAAGDPILGSEHDTELDNIQTHIATKANKVIGPTVDNIMTMTSGGDLKDSGQQLGGVTTAQLTALAALTTTEIALPAKIHHVRCTTSAGTTSGTDAWSYTKPTTPSVQVTHSFGTTNYTVVATVQDNIAKCSVTAKATNTFDITVEGASAQAFDIIVIED